MNRILTAILLVFCMLCLTPGISMATGGPDSFGYQYIDSSESGGPGYNMIDIHQTGTLVYLDEVDDTYSDPIGIGFNFRFYGIRYSEFYVSPNGFISFGDGSDSYNWDELCLPNTSAPEPPDPPYTAGKTLAMIAPLWADLVVDNSYYMTPAIIDPGQPGIYYEYFADSPHPDFTGPCMVVQWHKAMYYSDYELSSILFDFELIIFKDGKMLFQYGPGYYRDGVIGIQNDDGTIGLSYACNPEEYGFIGFAQGKTPKQQVQKSFTDMEELIPGEMAILFSPPVDTEEPVTEDTYTKYGKYTTHHKDKKFFENCFITVAAGEASGLFPMLMALVCALGGFLTRKRMS